jgi:hypothetical protein
MKIAELIPGAYGISASTHTRKGGQAARSIRLLALDWREVEKARRRVAAGEFEVGGRGSRRDAWWRVSSWRCGIAWRSTLRDGPRGRTHLP